MNVQKKREQEKKIVSEMIHLYCRKQHGGKPLCADCAALEEYAQMRSDRCPFMENKTFCSNCKVHCYQPDMREKIRKVMRFSGPRMILHHPYTAVSHVLLTKTEKMKMGGTIMTVKRLIFLILGCLCLALGTIGVFLPILPTVPFYLATVFCFSQSSQKLHDWFLGTNLYKKHLQSYVEKRGMLVKTKVSIITTVTLLMGFGFFMMARKGIWIPCIILAVVWFCHIVYFIFSVKTLKEENVPEE